MARFTNIGLPRKTFVSSAAEEARENGTEAGPSDRDSGYKAGGRDPDIAKRAMIAANRSQDRRQKRIDMKQAQTTCFACRGSGHAARDCPNILLAASGANGSAALLEADEMAARQAEETSGEINGKKSKGKGKGKSKATIEVTGGQVTGGRCYRCNSSAHSLSRCSKRADPANPTPYATCFICLGKGHLSAACPGNSHGVYVNGGSCKVCGSVAHRAKDCPQDQRGGAEAQTDEGPRRGRAPTVILGTGSGAGADEDDFIVTRRDDDTAGRRRHAPAKNGLRGPAKKPGDDGAVDPRTTAVTPFAKAKPKAKVVSF